MEFGINKLGSDTGRLSCNEPHVSADPREAEPVYIVTMHETDHLLGLCDDHDREFAIGLDAANELFDLAVSVYGDQYAILLSREDVTIDRVHFPSLRMAAQARDVVKPYVGMPATKCHPSDTYAGVVHTIRRNGREIDFASSVDADAVQTYTIRQDGYYRQKGTDKGAYLVLGFAEDYRSPEI